MNAISVRDLRKAYGANVVIDGFSLTVARGEIVAVLGPSGCGKSTLLRCIAGLELPDAGAIDVAHEVGVVFQEPRLLPWLTVRQNVAFAARDDAERARVDGAIDLVGLSAAADRLPKQLSGGMAQRAALARAFVRRPQVVLLDEPLAALDALRRLELQQSLAQILATAHSAALLVTHDVDEALTLADRAIVIGSQGAPVILELAVSRSARAGEPIARSAQRTQLLEALGAYVNTAGASLQSPGPLG